MIVFLTGYMGSGKTTLGKKLAARLGFQFVDLDKLIEQQTGLTIAEYFDRHGEASFRELERDVLRDTAFSPGSIVSTGGGLPCFFDNMERMNAMGTTVFIDVPPEVLASRVENGKQERPILRGFKGEALVQFIREKLKDREPFYRKAKLVIEGARPDLEKISALLTDQLR